MAYDARHKSIIAHAVALTGNIAAAARWVADNSIECGAVSDTTIRRFVRDPEFCELVAQSGKVIAEAREEAARLAERDRLKRAMEGSFGERIGALERKAWEIFEILNKEIENSTTDKRELMAYWQRLMDFVTKLKAHAVPAIAETWQAEALITAYGKVVLKKCGPIINEQIQREVSKEFQLALAARQATAAEATNGQAQTATAARA